MEPYSSEMGKDTGENSVGFFFVSPEVSVGVFGFCAIVIPPASKMTQNNTNTCNIHMTDDVQQGIGGQRL